MNNNNTNRIGDALKSIPLITLSLLILNVSIHGIIFLFSLPINWYAISAHLVFQGQYYRIISSAFVHNGILHLFMNMSTLIQLGLGLESRYRFGSLSLLSVTLFTVLGTGCLYVFMSWVMYKVLDDRRQLYTSGVGFSGVLFCYATIESYHGGSSTRSIFGMFNVPARIYPFVLLILLQVLIPGISFLGHLSGILIGVLISTGSVNILLPSQELLQKFESYSLCNRMVTQTNYVKVNNRTFGAGAGGTSLLSTIYLGLVFGITHVCNLFGLIGHVIGCPIDQITSSCLKLWACIKSSIENALIRAYDFFSRFFSSTSSGSSTIPTDSNEYSPLSPTNHYTPVPTGESIQV